MTWIPGNTGIFLNHKGGSMFTPGQVDLIFVTAMIVLLVMSFIPDDKN